MASKSGQQEPEKAEVVEELLDALDTALDRVKVLYEQYFLGIQKQPPSYLHTDVERKIRDIAQLQVRNTALRYRFVTLQQKFGAYNAYWRRTLRQIENGTYTRNLSKIGRHAARTGAAVPEEILAAMPRRMREQVQRDREAALALARLRTQQRADDPDLLTLADEDIDIDLEDLEPAAFIHESSDLRRNVLTARGPYTLDEADADFDLDAFFASVTREGEPDIDAVTPVMMVRPSNVPTALRPLPEPGPTGHPRPASPAVPGAPPRPSTSAPAQPAVPEVTKPAKPTAPAVSARPPASAPAPPAPQSARPLQAAPSQATRPNPVAPGASAVHAPTAVETLAGPFPRIPSIPALPNKQRPDPGPSPISAEPGPALDPARPDAGASAISTEPGPAHDLAPSQPAVDRAEVRRTPPPLPRTPRQGAQPARAVPSGERTPAPELVPSNARTPAPERLPSTERPPVPAGLPPRSRSASRQAAQRGAPGSRQGPPPGMSDADINALYATYVKAKQTLGEDAGPGAYAKLLKTINTQAPKIMEQYKAKGVDFSVVVRDDQVIIRAKPRP